MRQRQRRGDDEQQQHQQRTDRAQQPNHDAASGPCS
jgi:hypothetical protein